MSYDRVAKTIVRLIAIAAIALFSLAGIAQAEERIRSYAADIAVAKDGTLTVTERIRATVEGDRIKRGIYRDFPLTFVDSAGRTQRVGFDLLSVRRDGADEPYRTESIEGGIRIYTGDADVLLPDGDHTFELTYETDRQIRVFDAHDELYWNVTGNGWAFAIDAATAAVRLPPGVAPQQLDVFTGAYGATERNAVATATGNGARFRTTAPLGAGEGMTILVKLPKGAIDAPSKAQQRAWWLQDNLGAIIAIAGLGLVTVYYVFVWRRAGRDPARGVTVPRWDPPEGVSPALVNYIDNRGFSDGGWTALSAAALNLAVSGRVVLEDFASSLKIVATGTARKEKGGPWAKRQEDSLPTGEAALMKSVEAAGGTLVIDRANGPAVQKAGADFRSAMETEHRGKYYRANVQWIVAGVALSLAVFLGVLAFGNLGDSGAAIVIVPVFISVFVFIFIAGIGRSVRRKSGLARRILAVVFIAFFGFIAVSIFGSLVAMIVFEAVSSHQLTLLAGIGGITLVNLVFYFLMGAPTPLGAKMMDGIDGLRQYLTLAEKDRMNMAGAPTMSPRHFETLLPYAVALGVEKPWSDTFDTWLATAAAGAAAYAPGWYSGTGFSGGAIGGRMGDLGGSIAGSMQSALPPPPKSSSSGFSTGGGSSGGGGGGGGGGGW